jgi:hypothetical protein
MPKVLLLALLVYLASLWGAIAAPVTVDPIATVAPQVTTSNTAKPLVGFTINLHHTEKLHLYIQSIDQIAKLGANSLQIITPVFQKHGGSPKPLIEIGPGRGPQRQQIVQLLNHAHKRGLKTTLMPIVLYTDPRGNEWRGKTSPPDWDPWWQGYHKIIDYFTDIAVECNTDLFSVGSELLTTEKQVTRWEKLIAHVRLRYKGKLYYSTNWDHFLVPQFWHKLDIIGLSGYWDLTTNAKSNPPTPSELAARWEEIQFSVLTFASTIKMQVLLTEVGYHTLPWTLAEPWNYVNDKDARPDPEPQAMGYQSFLNAWSKQLKPSTRLAGVFFYAWDPYYSGGGNDIGYGVRGKRAHDILARWFDRRR